MVGLADVPWRVSSRGGAEAKKRKKPKIRLRENKEIKRVERKVREAGVSGTKQARGGGSHKWEGNKHLYIHM